MFNISRPFEIVEFITTKVFQSHHVAFIVSVECLETLTINRYSFDDIDSVVTMVTLLLLQSAGVTSPNTRSTTAAIDVISKDSLLDENDLYIKYKKLQKQLEFLQVELWIFVYFTLKIVQGGKLVQYAKLNCNSLDNLHG